LLFGRSFTDHMLIIDWNVKTGWGAPTIQPYGPFSIEPSAIVFHYGLECFEGMKAYKDAQQNIRLFRPMENMKRFQSSSTRMAMPDFEPEKMLDCIKELIKVDHDWIPEGKGYSLYIRPTMIATQAALGVGPTSDARCFTILSPVGPYYSGGFKAVSLFADSKNVRAWPGGTGNYKVGGNYAPTIVPQKKAASMPEKYDQCLWLFGDEITEVGTMNMFVFWTNEKGERELVTPPLDTGMILPGVTRKSVMELAQSWGQFKVTEQRITMTQLLKALTEGRLHEAFGAGTAAIVSPIRRISYNGTIYNLPLDPKDPKAEAGPLAAKLATEIMAIQYGETPFKDWSVVVK